MEPENKKEITEARKAVIKTMFEHGYTVSEIATRYQLPESTIRQLVK